MQISNNMSVRGGYFSRNSVRSNTEHSTPRNLPEGFSVKRVDAHDIFQTFKDVETLYGPIGTKIEYWSLSEQKWKIMTINKSQGIHFPAERRVRLLGRPETEFTIGDTAAQIENK